MDEIHITDLIVRELKKNSSEAIDTWITGNVIFEEDFLKIAESIAEFLPKSNYS